MSNFSFSHSVFKGLVLQTRENKGLFGKVFMIAFVSGRLEIILGKEENAVYQYHLLSLNVCKSLTSQGHSKLHAGLVVIG